MEIAADRSRAERAALAPRTGPVYIGPVSGGGYKNDVRRGAARSAARPRHCFNLPAPERRRTEEIILPRIAELKAEELSERQRALAQIGASRGGRMAFGDPWGPLLRNPELCERAASLGTMLQ